MGEQGQQYVYKNFNTVIKELSVLVPDFPLTNSPASYDPEPNFEYYQNIAKNTNPNIQTQRDQIKDIQTSYFRFDAFY